MLAYIIISGVGVCIGYIGCYYCEQSIINYHIDREIVSATDEERNRFLPEELQDSIILNVSNYDSV